MKFADIIEECVLKSGGGKCLAGELNVSASEISRIRAEEGKLTIQSIDKLISLAGFEIRPIGQEADLKRALKTMSTLYIAADQ